MFDRDFDKKNKELWSKATGINFDQSLSRMILRSKPTRGGLHDSLMQAIWHGPKFLNGMHSHYSLEKIIRDGKLVPYRYEDVDSSTMSDILEEYERVQNEKN